MTVALDPLTSADALILGARNRTPVAATRRCAVYLRVSLDHEKGTEGEGLAVDRQREDAHTLARGRGWTVVGEYVDNSLSASKRNVRRPGYDAMAADYVAGRFDALICYDLDRLTRQPRQLEDWIEAAEDHGLALVTSNGEADLTTDAGRLFARIKVAVARAEIERKGARQTRANRQRAERGSVPKGTRCTGYTSDGQVIEAEAATVRALFGCFARGETLRTLARDHGLTPSTVRGILTNPRYAGRRSYMGQVVGEGSWQPIVDGATFDLVNVRLADPKRRTNSSGSTARKYLGSGLYRCACGDPRPMVSGGNGGTRYACRGCGQRRNRAQVDGYVLACLAERLRMPDALEAMRPALDGHDRVAALLAEQSALSGRLSSLASLVADGTLSPDDVRDAVGPLRARLEAVRGDLATLSRAPVLEGLEGVLDRLEDVWPTLSVDRLRAILDAFAMVTVHRAQQGRRTFDPETVQLEWKA